MPITQAGNVIVYGSAGSGKTAFLQRSSPRCSSAHSPSQVHLDVLDFEAETLRAFQKAPHVGDVLCSYDAEKIENLFKMLGDEITRRGSLLRGVWRRQEAYCSESGEKIDRWSS